MKELQINVFQLLLFPLWFGSLILVGNKVFVVLEACLLSPVGHLALLMHQPEARWQQGRPWKRNKAEEDAIVEGFWRWEELHRQIVAIY